VLDRRGSLAALVPWRAPAGDDLEGLASMLLNRGLATGWGGNLGWYHPGSGLDSLIVRGLGSADPVARKAARDQAGTLLESDLPVIPLARIEETAILREGWTGAYFHPRGGLDLRAIHRGGAAPTS
jgi:ABC-type transport system substrate-binding protein